MYISCSLRTARLSSTLLPTRLTLLINNRKRSQALQHPETDTKRGIHLLGLVGSQLTRSYSGTCDTESRHSSSA